jgi:hypothetical protein
MRYPGCHLNAHNKIPRPKATAECETFLSYLGSMLTNNGRYTCEIKPKISVAKPIFKRKRTLFTNKMDL